MSRTISGSGVSAASNDGADRSALVPRPHVTIEDENDAQGRSGRRRPIPARERHRHDEATFDRLKTAGSPMRRVRQVVLVDQEIEVGREFTLPSLPEHVIFSRTAARRACAVALSFDAFLEVQPQPRARQWVLRPSAGEVRPEDLADAIRLLSASYDDAMKRLVASGRVAPLLASLHLRWMHKVQAFDIHIHCLWNSRADDVEGIRAFLGTRFGSVWHANETARNAGAVANYDVFGVVDHADFSSWPSDALLAVSNLKGVRFHRPAGAFAAFRKNLLAHGVRLRRGGYGIEHVPIVRRTVRRTDVGKASTPERGTFRGLRRVRLDGRLRVCAVHVVPDRDLFVTEGGAEHARLSAETIALPSVEHTNPVSTPRLVHRSQPLSIDPEKPRQGERSEEKTATRGNGEPLPQSEVIRFDTPGGNRQREGCVGDPPLLIGRRTRCVWWTGTDWRSRLRMLLLSALLITGIVWGALWSVWRCSGGSASSHRSVRPLIWPWPCSRRPVSFGGGGGAVKRRRLLPPIRADPRS